MDPVIVRFQKFCLRKSWIILGIMGIIPIFLRIWPLCLPFFLFSAFYYYKFIYNSLDETLSKTDVKKGVKKKDLVYGSNPKYQALDAYFFPFALLIGVGCIMFGFIIGDKLGLL